MAGGDRAAATPEKIGAVLLHVHPGNQLAFFEIAATLIPILLFGGIVAERVGPKGDNSKNLLSLGTAIAVIGSYAILAELFAIDTIVTGKPSFVAEFLTVTFLFGGMIGAVITLVYPWYARLRVLAEKEKRSLGREKQDTSSTVSGRRASALGATAGLLILAVFAGAAVLALLSLDEAGRDQFSEARSAAITQKTTEEAAVRSRILALLVAVARVEQQANVALARHEANLVIDGYQAELFSLRAKLATERKNNKVLISFIAELRHDEYATEAQS